MSNTFNPYAPPAETGGTSDPSPIPLGETMIPRIFGILSIVFSSVVIFLIALGALIGFIAHQAKQKRVAEVSAPAQAKAAVATEAQGVSEAPPKAGERRAKTKPLEEAAGVTMGLAWLFGTPLLLLIGIGQLRYKRWARFATLGWSGLVLLALVAFIGLAMAGGTAGAEMIPLLMVNIFSGVYPILLLIFFSRPRVAAAMVR